MSPKPISRLHKFFLVMSLVFLTPLSIGYIGTLGVDITDHSPPGVAPAYQSFEISAEEGRIRMWFQSDPTPASAKSVAGRSITWRRIWPPRLPDIKRSLFEIDNHPLPMRGGGRAHIIAFPIWFAAFPFLIAPALYFYRRTKTRPKPVGFAVVSRTTSLG